jgi:hypothetical protein
MNAPKPRVRLTTSSEKPGMIDVTVAPPPSASAGSRRSVLKRFTCKLNGTLLMNCGLTPLLVPDPIFSFTIRPQSSGKLELTWVEEGGKEFTAIEEIFVPPQ